jgi:hypothetical protein
MKNKSVSFLIILIIFLSAGCAKIYYSSDAISLAQSHKIIAIAPPSISIAASRKVDAQALIEQQKTESVNFQKEMYSWMLKRKMQGRVIVEIQDIETTNAKLKKAGYFDGTPLSPMEICEAIGVDGLMSSNYSLSKPMSEGAAIAVGLLVGVWGSTNSATVSISIHDYKTKKMIWNFDHKLSGGTFSTPAQIVDALMRQASRKMPYVTQ